MILSLFQGHRGAMHMAKIIKYKGRESINEQCLSSPNINLL